MAPRGHAVQKSKANLTHALLARKVALSLRAAGQSIDSIGVITPYRPQVSLIRELLDECALDAVSVGTVHRYQGSERDTIILDLTDSPPHQVGLFLGAKSLRDTGARLLNVALSRARRHLFVVANMDHLRGSLRRDGITRGIIDDIQRVAYLPTLHTFIGEPVFSQFANHDGVESPFFAFQAFDQELFFPALVTDLVEAKSEVLISTPTLSERVVGILHTLLRERIQRGLRVSVVVDGTRSTTGDNERLLDVIRNAGALVIRSNSRPAAYVVVDSEVVWLGSLSPADCLEVDRGLMARVVSPRAASLMLDLQWEYAEKRGEALAV